jgi:hypothetical protein
MRMLSHFARAQELFRPLASTNGSAAALDPTQRVSMGLGGIYFGIKGKKFENAHMALEDCLATREVLHDLMEEISMLTRMSKSKRKTNQ